ncbi:helix-turn-helix domain-containing protein [Streptomyces palmae]|uniref:XRE family transcriptional regulator n=1 Tax=Streptomyces palmae TaxID=1701085 RepID=A0A4Z0GXS5_9ACTN|nr:helix-turn-helix transcriptional regulator [Streptomyces palmae]TGB02594.1 XRE family transcriptional regulator [Streptomyces palmae]
MPQRTAPTFRQRRLGMELRKMRERAGMSAAQAGQVLGAEGARISNMESGRLGVSEERVRLLADIYSCSDRAYVDALAAMAAERGRGWWEEYRGKVAAGALDLAELEHHAVALRNVQVMYLPGLLQTEAYAKAVFAGAEPEPTPAQLRTRLSYRLRRRDVLDRVNPLRCTFLIHETALMMRFGGSEVLRGQLEHLLEASERENVTVRVIPFAAGSFPNAGSSTMYVHGPVPQLDTVQLDVTDGSAFLDAEVRLATFRRVLERVEEKALTVEGSRDFIHAVAKEL